MTPARRAAARQRFPAKLRQALAAAGITNVALADQLGVRASTISEWRGGIRFPSFHFAADLGDLSPELSALVIEAHSMTCEVCGVTAVQTSKARLPRFCSRRCKATAHSRNDREGRANEGQFAKRRLALYQDVVGAFCRQCSPEGCTDAACHLREVSPMPLIRRAAA